MLTAAWLAQLVGRQSAVREVEGSSPRSGIPFLHDRKPAVNPAMTDVASSINILI